MATATPTLSLSPGNPANHVGQKVTDTEWQRHSGLGLGSRQARDTIKKEKKRKKQRQQISKRSSDSRPGQANRSYKGEQRCHSLRGSVWPLFPALCWRGTLGGSQAPAAWDGGGDGVGGGQWGDKGECRVMVNYVCGTLLWWHRKLQYKTLNLVLQSYFLLYENESLSPPKWSPAGSWVILWGCLWMRYYWMNRWIDEWNHS